MKQTMRWPMLFAIGLTVSTLSVPNLASAECYAMNETPEEPPSEAPLPRLVVFFTDYESKQVFTGFLRTGILPMSVSGVWAEDPAVAASMAAAKAAEFGTEPIEGPRNIASAADVQAWLENLDPKDPKGSVSPLSEASGELSTLACGGEYDSSKDRTNYGGGTHCAGAGSDWDYRSTSSGSAWAYVEAQWNGRCGAGDSTTYKVTTWIHDGEATWGVSKQHSCEGTCYPGDWGTTKAYCSQAGQTPCVTASVTLTQR